VEEAAWSNPQMEQFLSEEDGPGLAVSLTDLVETFRTVLERAKNRPIYEIGSEEVNVPDMIRYLQQLLKSSPASEVVSVIELFDKQRSRRAMICLFLAILELVKVQAILLTQKDAFGDIGIKRHRGFDDVLGQSTALAAIEQEYN
jgi:segregation and condensation protein A